MGELRVEIFDLPSFPPPTLRECCHRGLARRRIALKLAPGGIVTGGAHPPQARLPTGQAREGYADRAGAGRVAFCGLGGMSRWPPSSRCELHNGLLLSALCDAALDQGLVSFADDGAVLASPQLSEAARKTLGVDAAAARFAASVSKFRDASRAPSIFGGGDFKAAAGLL
jgi:hypothetical protein